MTPPVLVADLDTEWRATIAKKHHAAIKHAQARDDSADAAWDEYLAASRAENIAWSALVKAGRR